MMLICRLTASVVPSTKNTTPFKMQSRSIDATTIRTSSRQSLPQGACSGPPIIRPLLPLHLPVMRCGRSLKTSLNTLIKSHFSKTTFPVSHDGWLPTLIFISNIRLPWYPLSFNIYLFLRNWRCIGMDVLHARVMVSIWQFSYGDSRCKLQPFQSNIRT